MTTNSHVIKVTFGGWHFQFLHILYAAPKRADKVSKVYRSQLQTKSIILMSLYIIAYVV